MYTETERASLTIDMQLQFKNNKTGLHWLTLVNAIQITIVYEDVFTADGSCLLVVFYFFKRSLLLCLIYLQDLALLSVHQIKSFSNNTEFEDFSSPPQLIPRVWINDFLWAETPQNSFYSMLCKTSRSSLKDFIVSGFASWVWRLTGLALKMMLWFLFLSIVRPLWL